MKGEVRAQLSAALEKIQSYQSGQRLLLKLSSVQGLIPKDIDYAEAIVDGVESENIVYKQILARRIDQQKVLINVVGAAPNSRMPDADSLLDGHEGAGYFPIVHAIRLDFERLLTSGIPMQAKSGERFLVSPPLDEILFHELQHVVDSQGTRRDNEFLKFRCAEALAVNAENEYRLEKNEQAPVRHAYVDAELRIKKMQENSPLMKLALSNDRLSFDTIRAKMRLVDTITESLIMNSGCKKSEDYRYGRSPDSGYPAITKGRSFLRWCLQGSS